MMAPHLSLTFLYVQPTEGSDVQLIITFQSLEWKHHLFLAVLVCIFGKNWQFFYLVCQ